MIHKDRNKRESINPKVLWKGAITLSKCGELTHKHTQETTTQALQRSQSEVNSALLNVCQSHNSLF